jgi:hypothetical protein
VLLRPGETTTADVDLGQLNEHGHATFGELYPVGSRLSVSYRRFARGDAIKVIFYSRVPD